MNTSAIAPPPGAAATDTGPPPSGAEPGIFADLLTQTTARTALAEGSQKNRPGTGGEQDAPTASADCETPSDQTGAPVVAVPTELVVDPAVPVPEVVAPVLPAGPLVDAGVHADAGVNAALVAPIPVPVVAEAAVPVTARAQAVAVAAALAPAPAATAAPAPTGGAPVLDAAAVAPATPATAGTPATPAVPATDAGPATPATPATPAGHGPEHHRGLQLGHLTAPGQNRPVTSDQPVVAEPAATPPTVPTGTLPASAPAPAVAQAAAPVATGEPQPQAPTAPAATPATATLPQGGEQRQNSDQPRQQQPPVLVAPVAPPAAQPEAAPVPVPAEPVPAEAAAPPAASAIGPQAAPPQAAHTVHAAPAVLQASPAPAIVLTHTGNGAVVEHIHDLVRVAGLRDGNARATLQLKPAELGTVNVHLRTTSDGLVATIRAHDVVALAALKHAGADLQQSLQDRGVNLARIELQLSSDNGSSARDRRDSARAFADGRGSGGGRGHRDFASGDALELAVTTTEPVPTTHVLADGSLVDVQA